MPRTKNQKGKLIILERFLTESTDAEHPVSMDQILAHLEAHDIIAERKSIYEDLDFLKKLGLDVQILRRSKNTGYYIGARPFALSELKLLVDAVQASKFITESKSLDLIGRIEKLGSSFQAKQLRHQVWVRGRIKTMNESVFHNVDLIHSAIESDSRILFHYYTWTSRKERILRREGAWYEVSPWALLLDNENYYLLGFEAGTMKHFRVDKMLDIQLSNESREGKEHFQSLNMAAYTDSHFGMFSGESTRVRLCFHNSMAGVAIDQFGADAMLIPYDAEHFTVTINVAVNVQLYAWLAGLGDNVRILEPQSAVDGMQDHMCSILRAYSPLHSLLQMYDSLLFVDLETTGFNPETDSITEFAAIKVERNGHIHRECTFVCLPDDASIPEEVVAINGITAEMCKVGISHNELYKRFMSLFGRNTLIIGYNAQFDVSFLEEIRKECDGVPFNADYLDVLSVYRDRARAPHKLSDAIRHYSLGCKNLHRASDDANALYEVTKALANERDDLLEYVNLFGYRQKYGICGHRVSGVKYLVYQEDEQHLSLPELFRRSESEDPPPI